MRQFGKEAEEQLISCARETQGHVAAGLSPSAALAKAAADLRLPHHMLPLAVSAYNTGVQAYHREKAARDGSGVMAALEDFPIARLEDVRGILYPTKEAQLAAERSREDSVSPEYSQPPAPVAVYQQKAAAAVASITLPQLEPQPVPLLHPVRAASFAKQAAQREVIFARGAASDAKDAAIAAVGRLRGYFKLADSLPPAEAAAGSVHLWGKQAALVFDYLFPVQGLTKQASYLSTPAQPTMRPYSLVKAALEALETSSRRQAAYQELARELPAKEAALLDPFAASELSILDRRPSVSGLPTSSLAKESSILAPLLTGLSAGLGTTLRSQADPAKRTESIELQLDDPDHAEELKSIQARAVLHDLMTNDEVISGYDPLEVTDVYNELVQLSPAASMRPALLRPLMRQRLTAGSLQPFDAQQMSDTESSIRKTQSLPVGNSPAGLMGDIGYVPGA